MRGTRQGQALNFCSARCEICRLLFWRLLFGKFLLDTGRKRLDPLDVGGRGPQLSVGFPFAIGEHARKADAVLGHPKDLGLGVSSAGLRELWNGGIKAIAGCVRLSGSAVATGAFIEIDFAAGDEIFVRGGNGIGRASSANKTPSKKCFTTFP